jgi:chromosomal replication initiation ATPase DnaA
MARKPRLHVSGGLYVILRGNARQPAEARALVCWLAIKTHAASLTALAHAFTRDVSTLSHAASRIDARSRTDSAVADTLDQHLNAISQA